MGWSWRLCHQPTGPLTGVTRMTDEPAAKVASDAADPSMEEILASIRRILNDDEVPALPEVDGEAEAERPTAAEEEEDDVLILDEAMMVAPPQHAPPIHVAEVEPRGFVDPVAEAEPSPIRFEPAHVEFEADPAPSHVEQPIASDLLGAAAAAATASSVEQPGANAVGRASDAGLRGRTDPGGYGARRVAPAAEGMAGRLPAPDGGASGAHRDRKGRWPLRPLI